MTRSFTTAASGLAHYQANFALAVQAKGASARNHQSNDPLNTQ